MTVIPEPARVADLMTRDLVSCPANTSLASVASTLAHRKVHAVFVLDQEGRPTGVVSDFDLLAGEWLGTDPESLRAMQQVTAAELMTAPVEANPALRLASSQSRIWSRRSAGHPANGAAFAT